MGNQTVDKLRIVNELVHQDPCKALALLRELESTDREDPGVIANVGGLLIDIGNDLRQQDLVREGICRCERAINLLGGSAHLFYNVANGHYSLDKLSKCSTESGHAFNPDDTSLLQAKSYYRLALESEEIDAGLRAQLWVHYGNCLSGLGRCVEAISAYDEALRVDPEHPMAKGNQGVELFHFAHIAGHPILAVDAHRMVGEALASDLLETCGGPVARASFERTERRIAAFLDRCNLAPTVAQNNRASFASEYQESYVEFCARHQLFLNFCLRCRRCERYCRDSLGFSLITDIGDETSFIRLSRVMNEIKERFAFARLLLFQSAQPALDTVPIDELTSYVDNLDYAVHGCRVASVKRAFEGAYDILDKIAHFINDYLSLGIKAGSQLTFTTNRQLWRQGKERTMRPELLQLENWSLYDLYDLARDLDLASDHSECNGYSASLRRLRNALTHEYLVLHVEGISWETKADQARLHADYRVFFDQTIALLQLVRAAIIYLIGFVGQEERKKHQKMTGIVLPMLAHSYDVELFDASLDIE